MSVFKPLKHGELFTARLWQGTNVGRFRARIGPVDPELAIRESWVYTSQLCRAENEGIERARGWNTKAARAFRVACAL